MGGESSCTIVSSSSSFSGASKTEEAEAAEAAEDSRDPDDDLASGGGEVVVGAFVPVSNLASSLASVA